MRALLSRRPGGPETLVLDEIPEPLAGPGQVRVAVRACGVNFPDLLIIQDLYQVKRAATVRAGRRDCRHRRCARRGRRGLARRRSRPHESGTRRYGSESRRSCGKLLEDSRCDAVRRSGRAASDLRHLTARAQGSSAAQGRRDAARARRRGRRRPRRGGIGQGHGRSRGRRGIQLQAKLAFAREHGADETVQYPAVALDKAAARALTDHFKSVCGANGAQVIFDPVGGDYTEAALRAIGWQGRHLVVGFTAGIPKLPLNLTLLKSCQIIGVFWGEFTARQPRQHAANVAALMALYLEGRIKPGSHRALPAATGNGRDRAARCARCARQGRRHDRMRRSS